MTGVWADTKMNHSSITKFGVMVVDKICFGAIPNLKEILVRPPCNLHFAFPLLKQCVQVKAFVIQEKILIYRLKDSLESVGKHCSGDTRARRY